MEEIDLREFAKTLWSKKGVICFIFILFVIGGFVFTFNFVTPKYTSKTTLILASINSVSTTNGDMATDTSLIDKDITVNSKLVSTYSELIKSKNILRKVINNLGIDINEDDLKRSISVDTVQNTELIQISVENVDNNIACEIANEIANVFKEQIKVYYDIENVQIVDKAEVEERPSNIHHKRDILIFSAIGMIIAIGYVFIVDLLDTSIKSIEDVEAITKLNVLATFPILDNVKVVRTRSNKRG